MASSETQHLADVGDIAANPPGADTDFFASNLTPEQHVRTVRLAVATNTSSKLHFRTSGVNLALNGDQALAANTLYAFDVPVSPGQAFNLRLAVDGTVRHLVVQGLVEAGSL